MNLKFIGKNQNLKSIVHPTHLLRI